jgi:hypothetical protein
MKHLIFLSLMVCLTGCAALPQFFQAAEDIADDTAIKEKVPYRANLLYWKVFNEKGQETSK